MSKFVKGESGNPAGRPPGSKSFQAQLRAALEEHGEEILEKLIERAKKGESTSGRFLIERLMPAMKSAPVQVPLRLEGSPVDQAAQIKNALAEGLLALDEARALLDALRTVEVVKAASELPDRIKEIEDRLAVLQSAPAEGAS
jgi:uncharacterized membrane-anchored protein